jgi:hypothetical protein
MISVLPHKRGGGFTRWSGGTQKDIFRYLGSMVQKDRDINEDVSHRIKTDWLK